MKLEKKTKKLFKDEAGVDDELMDALAFSFDKSIAG